MILNYVFQGRRWDKESKTYYFRARYYDPSLGRFINQDPIGYGAGDVNLYRFVGNAPIIWRDPYGLEVGDWWDIKANVQRAREIAQEELANRPTGHNNAEDAMRHAEWQRRTAEETNAFTAWAAGLQHEIEGLLDGQPWAEAIMDLYNNAVGREAAAEGVPVDPDKLQADPCDNSKYLGQDK